MGFANLTWFGHTLVDKLGCSKNVKTLYKHPFNILYYRRYFPRQVYILYIYHFTTTKNNMICGNYKNSKLLRTHFTENFIDVFFVHFLHWNPVQLTIVSKCSSIYHNWIYGSYIKLEYSICGLNMVDELWWAWRLGLMIWRLRWRNE